eukprot:TRINITY_DN6820_c2_g1_i1.p1 TRINITY_DN6820_c2_g1~~TRINITY_DN6820_c2_g1_i1.p1  ORF type:complete len:502 (+),score=182.50 TRINITY_DN6820_c2_g1_i1:129-1634(+)
MAGSSTPSFHIEVWNVLTGSDPRGVTGFVYDEVVSNPVHIVVEVLCVVYILYVWMLKPHRPGAKPPGDEPTAAEKKEMIDRWRPEPIADVEIPDEFAVPGEEPRVVVGQDHTDITVEGVGSCLDCASFNYLRMATNEEVISRSLDAVDHYGVGSCGPRGFYGTVQPHLVLEEHLQRVYKAKGAIIYSFQFSTTSSIIPCFSGRGDVLVVDKGVNMSLLNGVTLSRSVVHWFDHNNLAQLEEILQKVHKAQSKSKKALTRRWIVLEGVYRNHGDICPLAEIVRLRDKYKFRIIMDDSYGLGALGKTGLGTAEELLQPSDRDKVDVLTSALDNALGSTGGFCVGSTAVVDHQRLSSAGYCFSASLPPFAAVAATTALRLLQDDPEHLSKLRSNVQAAKDVLEANSDDGKAYTVSNASPSPIFHLRFPASSKVPRASQEKAFWDVTKALEQEGIAVTRPQYTKDEKAAPPASVRVVISSGPGTERVVAAAKSIAAAVAERVRAA